MNSNEKKAKSEVKLQKINDLESQQPDLSVRCSEHGKLMKKMGESERGLSDYFCSRGCKAEIGVGRVKKVVEDKGYGFIYTGGDDVFFHFDNLNGAGPVERGDLLKFRIGYNEFSHKLQAVRIESLDKLRG